MTSTKRYFAFISSLFLLLFLFSFLFPACSTDSTSTAADTDSTAGVTDSTGDDTDSNDDDTDSTGGDTGSTGGDTVSLASIDLAIDSSSVANGLSAQFTATGTYSDATTADITADVTYSLSNANASVDSSGALTAAAEGTVEVTASLNSIDSSAVTVTITAAELVSIVLSVDSASVVDGATAQFTATGAYTVAGTADITTGVSYSTSNSNAAVDATGVLTTEAEGTVDVMASLNGIESNTVTVTVTQTVLVSIRVSAARTKMRYETSMQLAADGTYLNGDGADLTSAVTWADAADAVTIDSSGLASTNAVGTAEITASLDTVTSDVFNVASHAPLLIGISDDTHFVVAIDESTGAARNIVALHPTIPDAIYDARSMIIDPVTGNLIVGTGGWGLSGYCNGCLYTVDFASGERVLFKDSSPGTTDNLEGFMSMAFHPNGTLYMVTKDYDTSNLILSTMDLATKVITPIGPFTDSSSNNRRGNRLFFDADGTLFTDFYDILFSINLATGAETSIGAITDADNFFDFFTGIARNPATGEIFGFSWSDFYRFDPATQVATHLGRDPDGDSFFALFYVDWDFNLPPLAEVTPQTIAGKTPTFYHPGETAEITVELGDDFDDVAELTVSASLATSACSVGLGDGAALTATVFAANYNAIVELPTDTRGDCDVSLTVTDTDGLSSIRSVLVRTGPWATDASGFTFDPDMGDGKAVAVGGKIYFFAPDVDGDAYTYEYDPATKEITDKGLGNYRSFSAVETLNGKIYLMGGSTVGSTAVWEFDPANSGWTAKEPMPAARNLQASAVVAGKIYLFGGTDGTNPVDTVYEFYPLGNAGFGTWSTNAPLAHTRKFPSASAFNGKIYVFGNDDPGVLEGIQPPAAYNPSNNTWDDTLVNGAGTYFFAGRQFVIGSTIYIPAADSRAAAALTYDTAGGSWGTMTAPILATNLDPGAFLDGTYYMFNHFSGLERYKATAE